jgi:hypothetical protein
MMAVKSLYSQSFSFIEQKYIIKKLLRAIKGYKELLAIFVFHKDALFN